MKVLFNEIKRIFYHHYIGLVIMLIFSLCLILSYNIVNLNSDTINNNISNIDTNVLNIFDINKDLFTNVQGYYIFIIKLLEIIFALYALILGANIASYDALKNTKDYLYTKEAKRDKIMINRILSALIILFIMTLLVLILSQILFSIFSSNFKFYILFLPTISLFIISAIFLGFGLIIGGFSSKHKILISIIVLIIFIIIHVLDIYFNLKILYYLNPFSFFNTNEILNGKSYPYSALLISLFYLVFSLSFGVNIYNSNHEQ